MTHKKIRTQRTLHEKQWHWGNKYHSNLRIELCLFYFTDLNSYNCKQYTLLQQITTPHRETQHRLLIIYMFWLYCVTLGYLKSQTNALMLNQILGACTGTAHPGLKVQFLKQNTNFSHTVAWMQRTMNSIT